MFSGTDRSCRMMAAFAVAGLLGLTAACGGGDDGAGISDGSSAVAGTTPRSGGKVDVTVSGKGMKGGCDAVHKIFAALEAGDKAAAETLKDKGLPLFDDVAATSATDLDTATDGATMASVLQFSLPEGPIYKSMLAEDYAAVCVAKYDAEALTG
jgi:hypothetical protein